MRRRSVALAESIVPVTDWLNRGHIGDAREVLTRMVADGVKVQMCVTSPPYWGLRDYGTAIWEGGDAGCDHRQNGTHVGPNRDTCGKCGARRIDQQIGLEATPDEYVETLVDVFRLVREVLADDGTLWLNMGDCYATGAGRVGECPGGGAQGEQWKGYRGTRDGSPKHSAGAMGPMTQPNRLPLPGLKPKDLIGMPWRVAFALQADGWYLRSDIIWHKPNPMPESVTDRPTKSHEYLFLLSKRANYYYDADAVREPHVRLWGERNGSFSGGGKLAGAVDPDGDGAYLDQFAADREPPLPNPAGRNRRTVWTIATEPFSEAHFATFPRGLVEPCILAGTSQKGHCPECGKRWARVVEREISNRYVAGRGLNSARSDAGMSCNADRIVTTLGWQPTCPHGLDPVPDIVFDPFLGSGTVAQVAQHLGRHWIGIDLNPHYTAMQTKRTAQRGLVLA